MACQQMRRKGKSLEKTMSAHHLHGLSGSILPSRTFGGQGRDRTGDTRIFSPLLYQLSYLATIVQGLNGRSAGIRTLDPVIKSHLLYQLSYAPIHLGFGARNGTRTRDNHLGKVALYQLSYPRIAKTESSIP